MNHSGEITVSASLTQYICQMQHALDTALDALSRSLTPVTVHACRTRARRIRAFLRTFRPAFGPAELARYENVLRSLARELAPVRTADVEQRVIERLAQDRAQPKQDGLDEVLAIVAHARSRAVGNLRARMVGGVWLRRRERLRQASSDPKLIAESRVLMAAMVDRVITRRRRRFRRQFRIHKPSAKALHKRRLKIKMLRYVLERCVPDSAAVRAELRQLRLLQDCLGGFHDEWILQRRLARQRPYLRANVAIGSTLLAHRDMLLHSAENHQRRLLQIWKHAQPDRDPDPRFAAVA